MKRAAALSNDAGAEEAANDYLRDGGSAVGAVLAGFFAAAGEETGILFAPVTILAAGTGGAARAFDGRCRQPGRGARRPRGFTEGEEIPEASRVAISASIPAAVVACAYSAGATVNSVVRPGITRARRAGAEGRLDLFERILAAGAAALNDPNIRGALLREAGPAHGGSLSPMDFQPPSDLDAPALDEEGAWTAPWASESAEPLGQGRAICAIDARGGAAGIAFRRLSSGFVVPGLDFTLPLGARPVLRGVPRITPGAAIPSPAPLSIRHDTAGSPLEVIAWPAAPGPLRGVPGDTGEQAPFIAVRRDPATNQVSVARR